MTTTQIINEEKNRICLIKRIAHSDERFETLAKEQGIEIIEKTIIGTVPPLMVVFPGIKEIECYEYKKDNQVKYAIYTQSNLLVIFSKKPSLENVFLADDIYHLELDIIQDGEKVWRDGIEMNIVEAAETKDIKGLKAAIREKIA